MVCHGDLLPYHTCFLLTPPLPSPPSPAVASCKDSLAMVTIDGERRSFEYNDRLSVLRVSQLGKDFYAARGTELCLFLKPENACPTLSEMCAAGDGTCQYALFTPDLDCCPVGNTYTTPQPPPPPSPSPPKVSPPPTDFPRCNCKRDADGSRMFTRLSYMSRPNETEHDGLTRVCFEVNTKDYCTKYNSPCCEFDLYKLEMEVVDDCKDALAYTTVNGAKKAPFYQLKPWPAIKVSVTRSPDLLLLPLNTPCPCPLAQLIVCVVFMPLAPV